MSTTHYVAPDATAKGTLVTRTLGTRASVSVEAGHFTGNSISLTNDSSSPND